MSEQAGEDETKQTTTGKKTALIALLLLLGSFLSFSLHCHDQRSHRLFSSEEVREAVAETKSPLIFAFDPVAMIALEESALSDSVWAAAPLTTWPPEGPVLAKGRPENLVRSEEMKLAVELDSWTLWQPANLTALPLFGLATVEIEDATGEVTTCERSSEGGHQCGEAGWTRMRRRTLTIAREDASCIWAHPIKDVVLRFRFPDVVATDPEAGQLWLESGLADASVGTGAAVEVRAILGDSTVEHHHVDRRGWQAVKLPTAESAVPLSIEISAQRPGRRHFCFRFDRR